MCMHSTKLTAAMYNYILKLFDLISLESHYSRVFVFASIFHKTSVAGAFHITRPLANSRYTIIIINGF